jgi:hypothetical protein
MPTAPKDENIRMKKSDDGRAQTNLRPSLISPVKSAIPSIPTAPIV